MNILLWGAFYIIATLFLLYFFIREKQVIQWIRMKEDETLEKVSLERSDRNFMAGNVLTIVALIVAAVFFVIVDKSKDPNIWIKVWGIYGVFGVNIIVYVLRKQHEWVFLLNLIMLFLGKLMFNILDPNFYIYLIINVVISLILIYLFRDSSVEKITEQSILKEAVQGNEELEKIVTESKIRNEDISETFKKIFPNDSLSVEERIAKEKRKKSTFGKALTRIDNALLAVILVAVIQMFYIGNYVIPTGSMEPTILVKDRVFTNMVKYHFSSPKVGQIIAFKEPMTDKVMYTKRIVGEPGTTLQIEKGKMTTNEFEIANVDKDPKYPTTANSRKEFNEEMKKYDEAMNKFNSEKVKAVGGAIMLNDKKSEVLERLTPQKFYLPEGLLMNNKIYIPKKGDKVKLDKVVVIDKIFGQTTDGTLVGQVDWESYYYGKCFKNIKGK